MRARTFISRWRLTSTMVPAMLQRRIQLRAEEGPPPSPRSIEELDAYVNAHISELVNIIHEVEQEIERLSKAKSAEERELRAWLQGALKGLQLALSAWSRWRRDG